MSFTKETLQKNKIPFQDVNAFCEQGKFTRNVYENQPLVVYTPILIAFCLTPTN